MAVEASIHYGERPLILSGPSPSYGKKGELDSAKYEVLVDTGESAQQLADLGFAQDQKFDDARFTSMWVQTASVDEEDDVVSRVTINLIGLIAASEKRLRKTLSAAQVAGLDAGEGNLISGSRKWNIREASLVVRDTYFTTVKPDTSVIGSNQSPPDAPAVPSPAYVDDENKVANFPTGWVLDDRQYEEHFRVSGTDEGLWTVEDTFGYYPEFSNG